MNGGQKRYVFLCHALLSGVVIQKEIPQFELRGWAITKDVDILNVRENGSHVDKNMLHELTYAG